MNMRIWIIVLLITTAACTVSRPANVNGSVVGSWKLMAMTNEPYPIDRITESDLIGGIMTFKEDGTFETEINYPQMPNKDMKFYGTYTVKNEVLTINNTTNNSTTKSILEFEKDFMIATPTNPGGFIAYYKRL